jgi:hypothetical protein
MRILCPVNSVTETEERYRQLKPRLDAPVAVASHERIWHIRLPLLSMSLTVTRGDRLR